MSSTIWDLASSVKDYGISMNKFLYVDGKPYKKGGKKGECIHHTEEEYREFIETIRENLFSDWEYVALELGWIKEREMESKE